MSHLLYGGQTLSRAIVKQDWVVLAVLVFDPVQCWGHALWESIPVVANVSLGVHI